MPAEQAWISVQLGESVGLAWIVSIANTKDAALESARKGIMYLLALYHSHFHPNISTTIEPVVDAGVAFVDTREEVRRHLAAVQERLHPEYFLVICDQGLLLLAEVKQQVDRFATLMLEFRD